MVNTVVGTNGNDTIFGIDDIDSIKGGLGDDILVGLYGNDTLFGDDGNDTLYGVFDNDVLYGGLGNDLLLGEAGNDKLYGDSGDDFLSGGDGDDTLNGGAGYDILYGESGNDYITGGTENDILVGQDGIDKLYGQDGNDFLSGGNNNDILYGGTGDDLVLGEAGDDVLYGEAGNDLLAGGEGNDKIYGGDGNNEIYTEAGNDTVDAGAGNDFIVDTEGNDSILGGAGDDVIHEVFGDDFIDGGDGIDYIVDYNGNDKINGGIGNDGIYDLSGNDSLNGGAGDDTIHDLSGNDTLTGGTGNDFILEFEGDDTYIFNIGDGNDIYDDRGGTDTLILKGKIGALNVTKNDLIFSRQDEGNLVINIKNTTDSITIRGWFGDNQKIETIKFPDGSTMTAQQIDNIVAPISTVPSPGNDSITVTDGPDVIDALAGDDVVYGKGSYDIIHGNDGNDTLYGQDGPDDLYGDKGNDVIFGGLETEFMYGGDGNDSLYGDDGNDYLAGENGNDYLEGGIGNDALSGGDGDDTMVGGTDNDSYYVDSGDVVIEKANEGIDAVWSWTNYTLSDNVENLYLVGLDSSGTLSGKGNSLDNIISLNYGGYLIYAGAGNDTIESGTGNDTLYGEDGNDRYNYSNGQDIIRDNKGQNTIYFNDLKKEDLDFAKNVNDLIISVPGKDQKITVQNWYLDPAYKIQELIFFDGSTMSASEIDSWVNTVTTVPTSGNDTIYADNNPNIIDALAGSDIVYGRDGNDTIEGNYGNDSINGGLGNDQISDSAGNDTLIGGKGNDTISDSQGNDSYIYNVDDGNDVIIDKAGTDTLLIQGKVGIYDVSKSMLSFTKEYGTDFAISINNTNDSIIIKDWFGKNQKIETIKLTDGTSMTVQEVEALTVPASSVPTSGIDIIYGDNNSNTINALEGNDIVYGRGGNDTLYGGPGNDVLYGEAGNDYLDGGSEQEILVGGQGNDTYKINGSGSTIVENSNEGIDSIITDYVTNYTLPDNVENLTLSVVNAGHTTITSYQETGNSLNNQITGTRYQDTINGGAGNDTLYGGDGDDALASVTTDYRDITASDLLSSDTLIGGAGNDVYYVKSNNDVVIEDSGQGTDTVYSSGSYKLGANIENLTLTSYNYELVTLPSGEQAVAYGDPLGWQRVLTFSQGNNIQGLKYDCELIGIQNVLLQSGIKVTEQDLVNHALSRNEFDDPVGGMSLAHIAQVLTEYGVPSHVESSNLSDLQNKVNNNQGVIIAINKAILAEEPQVTYKYDHFITVTGVVTNAAGELKGFYICDTDEKPANAAKFISADVMTKGWVNFGGKAITTDNPVKIDMPGNTATGNELNNVITGNSGNNVLTGNAGNDTLIGGAGDDNYLFNIGDNIDNISDSAGTDLIKLGSNVSKNKVAFFKDSSGTFSLDYGNSTGIDKVTVNNWNTTANQIEKIQLNDGTFITNTEVNTIIQSMASYATSHGITLTSVNDVKNNQDLINIIANNWHAV